MASFPRAMGAAGGAAPEPSFWIDATTPFYEQQPAAQLKAVAEVEIAKLQAAAGAEGVTFCRGPMRMGSSAIPGMPGSAMVDLVVEFPELDPPPPALMAALIAAGYEYRGKSPHDPQDHWAMGGEGPKGSLGRACLHLSPPGSGFMDSAVAFVGYLSDDPGAHAAYAGVKLEGARRAAEGGEGGGDRHAAYKKHKQATVARLMGESKVWARAGGGGG